MSLPDFQEDEPTLTDVSDDAVLAVVAHSLETAICQLELCCDPALVLPGLRAAHKLASGKAGAR